MTLTPTLTATVCGTVKPSGCRIMRVETANYLYTMRVDRRGNILSAAKVGGGFVHTMRASNVPQDVLAAVRLAS